MCEFCTKHGEGNKWYLQMKNYADQLLYEELTAAQKGVVGATTRFEWSNRFWKTFAAGDGRQFQGARGATGCFAFHRACCGPAQRG